MGRMLFDTRGLTLFELLIALVILVLGLLVLWNLELLRPY